MLLMPIGMNCFPLQLHFIYTVPDTPISISKTSRDSKESTPVPSNANTNDAKPQPQSNSDRKSIHRDNSHESDKENENDRRVPIVNIELYSIYRNKDN